MPLQHTLSSASMDSSAITVDPASPSGPFSGPSHTTWRRQRLLRIGSNSNIPCLPFDADESSFLNQDQTLSYGTLPARRESPVSFKSSRHFFRYRNLPALSGLTLPRVSSSQPATPAAPQSPSSFRGIPTSYFRINMQRPISAYDAPLVDHTAHEDDLHARTNGIRVWYSSFASIDWLHDAIKDSVRFSRLRRGKSFHSKIRLLLDKSIGWIVVTLVGFITALVAFLIIRGEQWFFDLKEGHCHTGWTKAKRFCCPIQDDDLGTNTFYMGAMQGTCPAWRTWAEVLGVSERGERMVGYRADLVQYIAYTFIALLLALTSCVLTIYLTASTSFVTRKESGVLSPSFVAHDNKSTLPDAESTRKVLYYAAGSGIPEIKTILSGFVIHGYLGARVLITKSIGLALSVASGLSLGKEGPFVHIASCIGNIISRFISKYENNEAKRREILSAACAAGVAVAFGAPIGGTLFSLEEVSYFFPPKVMWRSFFCAMIAAITLRLLDPFGTGKLVLFQVTYDKEWHAYELIFFLLLGVFGGVYGAYFSKLNFRWSRNVRNKSWLKTHPIFEVMLVTLVTTVLCFLNPYTRMGGTELVYELFAECRTGGNAHSDLCVLDPGNYSQVWPLVRAILVAMVVKGALTVVTFGIRVPAGIFIPTLGVGACAGRLLGIGMQWLQWKYPESRMFAACGGDLDCVVPGLYAMVGAAATLSGVTRTTVSLAVIMFELTDTLTYAVPVMLAVLVAKTVADVLEPKGIYDLVIELSQLPFLDVKIEYVWGSYQINDVTDRDIDVIRLDRDNTVESLRDQLQNILASGHDDAGFPILSRAKEDGGTRLVGYIGANELEHALSIVADEADQEVLFHTAVYRDLTSSSVSSLVETHVGIDPFDFSVYMDQAPLTIQSNSPLHLVHQFFVKLGARYVVVTDIDGDYEGIIDKKTWLAFLSELEERS